MRVRGAPLGGKAGPGLHHLCLPWACALLLVAHCMWLWEPTQPGTLRVRWRVVIPSLRAWGGRLAQWPDSPPYRGHVCPGLRACRLLGPVPLGCGCGFHVALFCEGFGARGACRMLSPHLISWPCTSSCSASSLQGAPIGLLTSSPGVSSGRQLPRRLLLLLPPHQWVPCLFRRNTWSGPWEDLAAQPRTPGLQTGVGGWMGGHTALPAATCQLCCQSVWDLGGPGCVRVLPRGLAFLPGGRVLLTLATLTAGAEPAPCCRVGALATAELRGWARRGVGCPASRHPVTSQWLSLPLCPAPDGCSAAAGTGHHVPGLRGLHLL